MVRASGSSKNSTSAAIIARILRPYANKPLVDYNVALRAGAVP